jgi:hypothetical protein
VRGFSIVHSQPSVRHPARPFSLVTIRSQARGVGNRPETAQAVGFVVELVIQATDSTSRSRDEITADTPSPRMVTP